MSQLLLALQFLLSQLLLALKLLLPELLLLVHLHLDIVIFGAKISPLKHLAAIDLETSVDNFVQPLADSLNSLVASLQRHDLLNLLLRLLYTLRNSLRLPLHLALKLLKLLFVLDDRGELPPLAVRLDLRSCLLVQLVVVSADLAHGLFQQRVELLQVPRVLDFGDHERLGLGELVVKPVEELV